MSHQPAPAPLLIACALGIEHLALRTGDRRARGAGAPVPRGAGRG
ncbi:1-hydroxy-2-methyl-2-butenyl 4-diphosphate reductase, partial [Streptomyces sp. CSDS2]|nr:1-hydroxy-2-methyl-2-butenyl 4-diphosphate reductase [Streptomyces sp. CSDS2]